MLLFRAKKVNRNLDDFKVLTVGIILTIIILLVQISFPYLCNDIYIENSEPIQHKLDINKR